ncbi:bifunctional DNA-formamidopyrimidine glycosylase/DNA-(apurinic or apyrimidinic site) lyase [Aristophania vespae]|uniref:bifunctional DNA-formamidopyrimidine glycosylase/DNA-(apurinic or apyrimidinic site) lyase n=1 Tax=Aristophania vespae TaxID=2697033 RepID=UPI0023513085|nr:bifunctional DNA-formamidopyrimidine glycosylase/DNA-(apurinic or apyrimidinic site) lyase [Aristophania vespae]UMM63231.1 Formamidopyrimidine-DNA glycosylase [Aristophania vespae]
MPELPEVETIMQGLVPVLKGKTITHIAINRPDLRKPFPPGLKETLEKHSVIQLRRRAKYILIDFSSGHSLLIHLGMSGRIFIDHPPLPPSLRKHEHFSLTTQDGLKIALIDPRRFGLVTFFATEKEKTFPLLAHLGLEPLEPEALKTEILAAKINHKRSPIKSILLDQRIIAGLGNIYVCEALFRASIHPERSASSLKETEIKALCNVIPVILREALAAGGSSLRDYVKTDGQKGGFQTLHQVYGKEGEQCPSCPGLPSCEGIKRLLQSGRSSFYCPYHQKLF